MSIICEQDALAEEIQFRSVEALPLEVFDLVDDAFRGTIAPRQGESGSHGCELESWVNGRRTIADAYARIEEVIRFVLAPYELDVAASDGGA